MNIFMRSLFLLAAAGLLQTHVLGRGTPFTLKLSASSEDVKAGSQVRIEIIFTNTSDQEIHLSRPPGDVPEAAYSYAFEVRDEKGELVPETRYGRPFKDGTARIRGSWAGWTLKPGESLKEASILNQLFDLSLPGRYTVRVSHEIPQGFGKGSVKSNTITITIAP
jgi:hypothetical protein